jgi:phasin family protein
MSKATTVNQGSADAGKAAETMEKGMKASQAAAEKAVKAGRETAEKAFRASSDAASKAYDQVLTAARDTVQKTFPQATARFDELAGFQRANMEALFSASSVAMKGVESACEEMLAFNRQTIEDGVANAKKLLECRTVQDLIETQAETTRLQIEHMLAHGTKVTDIALKMAGDIAAPLQDRFSQAAERFSRPTA